jgi:N-acetylneuraminic acid mutarotase
MLVFHGSAESSILVSYQEDQFRTQNNFGLEIFPVSSAMVMKLWQKIEYSGTPGPRAAHSFDVLDNKIVVFGGWNGRKALNDLHIFDFQTETWTQSEATPETPSARNNHATVVFDNKLFVHGGHDGTKWLSDMYILSCSQSSQEDSVEQRSFADNLTWSRAQTSGVHPSPRACHTMSRVGRKIYLFGGYNGSVCYTAIEILDLDTMTWIQPTVTGNVPTARNAHSMTVVGKLLYMFGGHSGSKHLNDLQIFDTTKLEWSTPNVTGSIPQGLRGHSASLVGNKIVVFAGYDGKARTNDLYFFDLTENRWQHPNETEEAPPGRQRHTSCLVGTKKLLIYGGFNGTKWLSDLYLLDIGKFEESELNEESNQHFVSNMASLINKPEFSDMRIVVQGKPIFCHRAILACQCERFQALLTAGMRETTEKEIIIHDWTYEAYMALITYIYTGRLPPDCGRVDEVLGLADQYTFESLKQLTEKILINSVEIDNVCHLLKIADQYGAADLKKHCLNFILKSFDQVVATESFEQLSSVPHLLMEVTKAAARNTVLLRNGAVNAGY